MIRRKILIGLLGLGTVIGFGSGIGSLRHGSCAHERHSAFEKRVAHVCAEAAKHPESAPTADEAYRW